MIHEGRFAGKAVVVTGAAQGIGEAVAQGMAREQGRVALVDRAEFVSEVRDELAAEGCEVVSYLADLEQYQDCSDIMARARDQFGRIDILVNNVGGTIWAKPYEEYEEKQIEAEIRRSLFPTLWCCRAVLPHMISQGGGVNALTASLAWEHAGQGIRVLAIAPGGTEAPPRRVPRNPEEPTEQEKAWYQQIVDQTVESSLLKRYGTVQEQAAAILFFASDEASYITGLTLPVAGGDLG